MKKVFAVMLITVLLAAGCGSSNMDFAVDTAPDFKEGQTSDFIIKVTDEGKGVTGLSVTATLEMEKMDHGTIEVAMEDIGNGQYKGSVKPAMPGEWIADIKVESGSKTIEKVLTFEVKER